MQVLKKTKLTRTVSLNNGETMKVKLSKNRHWNRGSGRMVSTTSWVLPGLMYGSRKQVEAVLLARESGLSWDDAKNENTSNWVQNNDPALL